MKNTFKLFGIIVLVAIIGFSTSACDDGSSSNGGNGGGSISGMDTLNLSGRVFLEIWNDSHSVTYQNYNGGNLTVSSECGGSGKIENGNLNFSIGTPANMQPLDFEDEFGWGYDNVTSSSTNVSGVFLYLENSGDYWGPDKQSATVSGSVTSYSGAYENVSYIYVDKDVTVSGKGKTETNTGTWEPNDNEIEYTDTNTTKDFSLSLKTGWNAVYYKTVFSETIGSTTSNGTYTDTISLSNPSLRWVLGEGGPDPIPPGGYSFSLSRSLSNVPEIEISKFKVLDQLKQKSKSKYNT